MSIRRLAARLAAPARLAAQLEAKEAASNRLRSTCVLECHGARKKSQVLSGIPLAAPEF
jgi:hypothetical protein